MLAPLFAEYRCVKQPPGFTVQLPWAIHRLPLDPRADVTVGREASDIHIEDPQAKIIGFGGRRNHIVWFSLEGHWVLSHTGHSEVVHVDGVPTAIDRRVMALRDGARVRAAPTLEFQLDLPTGPHRTWGALGPVQRGLLDEMERTRPPRTRRDGVKVEEGQSAPAWWPPSDTPAKLVMLDWLMERGLGAEDAEVELAHLHAWHAFMPR